MSNQGSITALRRLSEFKQAIDLLITGSELTVDQKRVASFGCGTACKGL